ncbi:hydrogenase maturation protease [Halapricum sp. CBA1109]|uniref:hydrogenase maturation protease n=1 Tax=Halapricum sp. CBA1109 TaxID=2668068 RepID=UPI0012F94D62|nr:hydrogenase maturation protease [Halapricum sp. CBA1109]
MTDSVVGVGNPLMSDDGVGAAVVESLDGVGDRCRHTGTNGFLALEAMDGTDRAVLVDAVDMAEPPGSVLTLPFDGEAFAEGVEVTMHDISVAEALSVGVDAYDLPSAVWLVGVVPETTAAGTELSDSVRAAVPEAAGRVRGLLT